MMRVPRFLLTFHFPLEIDSTVRESQQNSQRGSAARCDAPEIQQRQKNPELGVAPVAFFNVTQISSVLFLVRRLRFSELLFAYRIPPRGSAHPPSLRVLSLSVCIFDLLILFRVCTSSAVFFPALSEPGPVEVPWDCGRRSFGAPCIVPPLFLLLRCFFSCRAMESFVWRCGPCRSPSFASGV